MTVLVEEIRSVPRPDPVLDREREAALTTRQRELLDELSSVFDEGFAHLTMADLAGRLGCSLRTLYQLAPSRDQLVLMVIDRNLWRVGRSARRALGEEREPIEAIATYLHAANRAVARTSEPFARDVALLPTAVRLQRRHEAYLIDVTERLLDLAVKSGDLDDLDTRVVAQALATPGAFFAQPDLLGQTRSDPTTAANLVVDLILAGLRRSVPTPEEDPT